MHRLAFLRTQLISLIVRQRRRGRRFQPLLRGRELLISFMFSMLVITALAVISEMSHYTLLIAPFGASAMLLFGYPVSPLAQPRNLVLGNSIGAITSIALSHLFGHTSWVMGLSVALTLLVCAIARCLHPPAGGVALLGVYLKASPMFFLFPVLTGSVILCVSALLVHRLLPTQSHYPEHWF